METTTSRGRHRKPDQARRFGPRDWAALAGMIAFAVLAVALVGSQVGMAVTP